MNGGKSHLFSFWPKHNSFDVIIILFQYAPKRKCYFEFLYFLFSSFLLLSLSLIRSLHLKLFAFFTNCFFFFLKTLAKASSLTTKQMMCFLSFSLKAVIVILTTEFKAVLVSMSWRLVLSPYCCRRNEKCILKQKHKKLFLCAENFKRKTSFFISFLFK